MKTTASVFAALCLIGAASAQTLDDLKNDGRNTDNILTYGMGYHLNRYSPLKQIDKTSVKRLVPVWNLSLDNQWGEQAQPLVKDGVMYVTNARATVAIDAVTGRQIWKTPVDWLPETPRIVVAQRHPGIENDVRMVMQAPRRRGGERPKAAGHPEMNEERIGGEAKEQVLASPVEGIDGSPGDTRRKPAWNRPPQAMVVHAHHRYATADDERRNPAERGFDFGQFRHGSLAPEPTEGGPPDRHAGFGGPPNIP